MSFSAFVRKRLFRAVAISLFFSGSLSAYSQSFEVNFNIHLTGAKVYLNSFYGEKTTVIDSAVSSPKGEITFLMGARREPGMYRISVSRQQYLDFIFNRENIVIDMDLSAPGKTPKALVSKENDIFYRYMQYDIDFHRKLSVLLVTGSEYPDNDDFYQTASKQYQKLIAERKEKIARILTDNKGSYVAHVIALTQEPVLDWKLSDQERKSQLREHFFDNFSLRDSILIRTNLLTAKAIDYLTLYTAPNMSQSEVEAQFIKGVDVVLAQVEKSPMVYEFMLSYLVGGFEKYKMEKVLVYLYEKYLSGDHCPGDVKQDELSRRLKAYEQLAVGKIAPDLSSRDKDGKPVTLAALNKDYYLLVFYASWCPHCHDLLTNLPDLAPQLAQQNVGVITVTLDSVQATWTDYLSKNNLPWINTFDGAGWNGPTIRAYNIYATPTMFLVDRQRKIMAKPITYNELKEELKRLAR